MDVIYFKVILEVIRVMFKLNDEQVSLLHLIQSIYFPY